MRESAPRITPESKFMAILFHELGWGPEVDRWGFFYAYIEVPRLRRGFRISGRGGKGFERGSLADILDFTFF